jgi:hypothetical protein
MTLNKPLVFRFPDGETVTLKDSGDGDGVLVAETNIPSSSSYCTHFGMFHQDDRGKWSAGWNGISKHEWADLEEALAFWRGFWHRRFPCRPTQVKVPA